MILSTSGTERMRITSAGLVGIGTSSPQALLETSQSSSGATAQVIRLTNPNGAANTGAGIQWNLSTSNAVINGEISLYRDAATSGNMLFKTTNTSGTLTEAMRIDSSQNVGLGVTPSAWYSSYKALQIKTSALAAWGNNEFYLMSNAYGDTSSTYKYLATGSKATSYVQYEGTHIWQTAGTGTAGNAITFTPAMTLDDSGRLFVGRTSASAGNGTIAISNVSAATGCLDLTMKNGGANYMTNTSGTAAYTAWEFDNNGGSYSTCGSIVVSGTTTSYNTTSDQRLKTNIVDAPSSNIDDIKVRSFDWIVDGSHQEYGMVAQELLEVAPYAVNKPENPDEMMAVDYSKLVPMMIKEIQSLRQRILTLENK
jgi:hypothetical protein